MNFRLDYTPEQTAYRLRSFAYDNVGDSDEWLNNLLMQAAETISQQEKLINEMRAQKNSHPFESPRDDGIQPDPSRHTICHTCDGRGFCER